MGEEEGGVGVGEGEGGDEGVGGRRERVSEGGVERGERRRGNGVEERVVVEAIEKGFVEELMVGEAAERGEREAVGAEEREKGGEDFGVAVDEDGVGVGGERENGIGAEGGRGGLKEGPADVELDAVAGWRR